MGNKTFATISGEGKVRGPDCTAINAKIKRAQRVFSRRKKGSNRWQRAKLRVARLHSKKAAMRSDFLHKLSSRLVRDYQLISLEDLNVSSMVKNRSLARAISEQGWQTFRTLCESKAVMYPDREVVVISRWEPTSQVCSECGYHWGKIDLSVRKVHCLGCGAEHDRDENASANIKAAGHTVRRGASVRPHNGAVCAEAFIHLEAKQLELFTRCAT